MSDTLPDRFAPPLSATSDMPDTTAPVVEVVATPEPAASEEAPQSETAPEGVESSEAASAEVGSEQEADVEAPEPEVKAKPAKGVGKALEAQRQAIEAANRRADELQARVEAAERRAAAAEAAKPVVEEKPEAIPERTAYEDPNEFYKALGEWSGRQATRTAKLELAAEADAKKAADDKAAADNRNATALQTAVHTWNERKAKAVETMPDYAEVAEADGLAISQTMAETILHADNGPAIAYHLGKNPDEAKRIWSLAPGSQIYEIGQIAAKLSAPKPNVSRAPDPIKPIRASSAPANKKAPAEMSMDEYAVHRQAQINASRRRPGSAVH